MTDYVLSQSAAQVQTYLTRVMDVPGTALKSEFCIDVRRYGATGDGVTDDSTAIRNAVADMVDGSTLYFPIGIYRCNSQITLPSTFRICIAGDGYGSQIVQRFNDGTHLFAFDPNVNRVNYNEFKNLSFSLFADFANTAGSSGNLIHLVGQTGVKIIDCEFDCWSQTGYAVYINGNGIGPVFETTIQSCHFWQTQGAGYGAIYLGPLSSDSKISNCIIGLNGLCNIGIFVDGSTGLLFSGSHVWGAKYNNMVIKAGGNAYRNIMNVLFDGTSQYDSVAIDNSSSSTGTGIVNLVGCAFQGTPAGSSDISLTGTSAATINHTNIVGCMFISNCTCHVNEGAYTTYTSVTGCQFIGTAASRAVNFNSSTSYAKNCIGLNPVGYLSRQPSIPATTVTYTNAFGFDCRVYVIGGTVTAIAINGTATGLTSGQIIVSAGETIRLTYSSAPTWKWFGM